MAIDLQVLKNEAQADPKGYGFGALWTAGNDTALAVALNLARDGSNGGPAISLNRGTITTQELVEALVQSEVVALSQGQRDWLALVASGARVRVDNGSTARAGLLAVFGGATTTRANLIATAVRPASRAEELFGLNTVISTEDLGRARQA